MRKNIIIHLLLSGFLLCMARAKKTEIVEEGDTLSEIVDAEYRELRLYGEGGVLQQVVENNSFIKDPDLIFPGQKIDLTLKENAQNIKPEAFKKNKEVEKPDKSEKPPLKTFLGKQEGWSLAALYGFNYASITQEGDLIGADLGVLLLHALTFRSEYSWKHASVNFEFFTYDFDYESSIGSDSVRLHSFLLGGTYHWGLLEAGLKQLPFFRSNNGSVDVTKQTLTYIMAGVQNEYSIPALKSTTLDLKLGVSYLLSAEGKKPMSKSNLFLALAFKGRPLYSGVSKRVTPIHFTPPGV